MNRKIFMLIYSCAFIVLVIYLPWIIAIDISQIKDLRKINGSINKKNLQNNIKNDILDHDSSIAQDTAKSLKKLQIEDIKNRIIKKQSMKLRNGGEIKNQLHRSKRSKSNKFNEEVGDHIFEMLSLLLSVHEEKIRQSQEQSKFFSRSAKKGLTTEEEENLNKITKFYTGLNKGKGATPNFKEMEEHRNYLLKLLYYLISKDKTKVTSENRLTSSTRSLNFDENQDRSTAFTETTDISQNPLTSIATQTSTSTDETNILDLLERTSIDEPPLIRSKQVTQNVDTDKKLSHRIGQAGDLQNLDVQTAALLLHQLQTQGDVNLIPDYLLRDKSVPNSQIHNLVNRRNPDKEDNAEYLHGSSLTSENQQFEAGLLKALHSAATSGLNNPNINTNPTLFGDPSEYSDYSAIADVLLTIEQLNAPTESHTSSNTDQENIEEFIKYMSNLNRADLDSTLIPELVDRLQLPPGTNIRFLTPDLTAAVTTFLTSISLAITTFITAVQEAIVANPLIGVLLALALAAILAHIFGGYFVKPHKGGGGGGGYHKRVGEYGFDRYDRYRAFQDPSSELFIERVLRNLQDFEYLITKSKNLPN